MILLYHSILKMLQTETEGGRLLRKNLYKEISPHGEAYTDI
jgi:hypothetical protein